MSKGAKVAVYVILALAAWGAADIVTTLHDLVTR